jgi:uncharacterized protein YndB with AHSA1/START domain
MAAIMQITIDHIFNVPPLQLFNAWTMPGLVAQWWGPYSFSIPVCVLDPRPGGSILIVMRDTDENDYTVSGRFCEIAVPDKLVFVSGAFHDDAGMPLVEMRTTILFVQEDGGTRLLLNIIVEKLLPAAEGIVSVLQESWKQSLDKLDTLLHQLFITK